jgi:putative FmdB family regulatory protein
MPLYEYECQDCGVRFERQQSIMDEAITTCPECGGEVKRRWPAHSVPPTMLQQLDELEEELEREVNGAVEDKHSAKADGRGGLWKMPT